MKFNQNMVTIISILARLLAFIAVLAFVFEVVYFTNNLNYLWLLFLLLAVELIPVYEFKITRKECNTDKNDKEEQESLCD